MPICSSVGMSSFVKMISSGSQPFLSKPAMLVHHHGLECCVKKWGAILKMKVIVRLMYNQNMTVSTKFSELMTLCNKT